MKVYIMQGVPGSGKSTHARKLVSDSGGIICSADDFFLDESGKYNFNPALLGKAHASCMKRFLDSCNRGGSTVIVVDNTNITIDQMSPYYVVARAYEADVEIVRVRCNPILAAERNTHGVPRGTVMSMAARMQDPPKFWEATFTQVGD